jgi:cyclopropane fatty-acyl-phospholipid synthase-like methyltransferase
MTFFDQAYEGVAPWDTGTPQPEIVALEESGEIESAVLDVGCGTGETALYLAARGHEVMGVDAAPRAIERAQAKAQERGIPAVFFVHDVLDLPSLGGAFDTVIDTGLFHTLSDENRPRYVRSLAAILRPGGRYFMLAFSELEPPGYGPRRVTQAEIRAAFADGWRIRWIRPAAFDSRIRRAGPRAWLSSIARL